MAGVLSAALVFLGLATTTLGVVRLPDVYTQLHASGKAAFLGVSALPVAATLDGDGTTIAASSSSASCSCSPRRGPRDRPGRGAPV